MVSAPSSWSYIRQYDVMDKTMKDLLTLKVGSLEEVLINAQEEIVLKKCLDTEFLTNSALKYHEF